MLRAIRDAAARSFRWAQEQAAWIRELHQLLDQAEEELGCMSNEEIDRLR